jgi:ABC-type transport system involved in cytochrome c biogenesis permease subunit
MRNIEFLKGLVLPVLVALPLLATEILCEALDDRFDTRAFENLGFLLAVVGVIVFVAVFAVRWWKPHRVRAVGLIYGLVATPAFLLGLFMLALQTGGVQLGPR